jgi:dUTP pyrophosphatase
MKEPTAEQLADDILAKLRPALDDMALASVNKAVEQVLTGPTPTGLLGDALAVAVDHWRQAPISVRAVVLRGDALPKRQTDGSSGYDLTYQPLLSVTKRDLLPHINAQEPGLSVDHAGTVTFYNGNTALLPTGLALKIPAGFEAQIRPRSGFACQGLYVSNSPGTVDSDYAVTPATPTTKLQPAEIKVLLRYDGPKSFTIRAGERIAQIVFAEVVSADFDVMDADKFVAECAPEQGAGQVRVGGFGSTGSGKVSTNTSQKAD